MRERSPTHPHPPIVSWTMLPLAGFALLTILQTRVLPLIGRHCRISGGLLPAQDSQRSTPDWEGFRGDYSIHLAKGLLRTTQEFSQPFSSHPPCYDQRPTKAIMGWEKSLAEYHPTASERLGGRVVVGKKTVQLGKLLNWSTRAV